MTGWPESAHSLSVVARFVSNRLSGIVLMAMKLFSFDNQLTANFSSNDKNDHDIFFYIIQHPQVSDTELEFR